MTLAFSYSRPTTDSILSLLNENISGIDFDECKFYVRGLHDNFLLKAGSLKYILRLYRTQWRTEEAIRFELDVLNFLKNKGLNVSAPIQNNQLDYLLAYDAPEGRRFATLYPYAKGVAPDTKLNLKCTKLLGQSVAKLHLSLDDFESEYSKVELDEKELIDHSIIHISNYITETQLDYLRLVGDKIKGKLSVIDKKIANFGVVTGDINFRNFHIDDQNHIIHFDFDQCGYAYRAFELGKFASFIAPMGNKQALFDAFLSGYSEHIKLTEDELKTIPLFEMASVIWVMAIAAQNIELIGYKWVEGDFWVERIARLKKLEETFIASSP